MCDVSVVYYIIYIMVVYYRISHRVENSSEDELDREKDIVEGN